jgi:uncharacterized protein YabN with tetrapyrrole methylase and pyrophosphatase domain
MAYILGMGNGIKTESEEPDLKTLLQTLINVTSVLTTKCESLESTMSDFERRFKSMELAMVEMKAASSLSK